MKHSLNAFLEPCTDRSLALVAGLLKALVVIYNILKFDVDNMAHGFAAFGKWELVLGILELMLEACCLATFRN